MVSVWETPGLVERLTELWDAGQSASAIARQLGNGITRNSVVGRISRMRGSGAQFAIHVGQPKQHGAPLQYKVRTPPKVIEPVVAPVEPMLRDGERITMMNARYGDCRYSFGEVSNGTFYFCGHSSGAESWCDWHKKICFQPQQSRKIEAA